MTDEEIKKLKEEVHTWKEASSANSYKAFQLQEENKTLSQHVLELQKDKGELTDRCKELEKENAELQDKLKNLASVAEVRLANWQKYEKENVELKESITKFSKNGLDFLHSMKSNRNCIDCESKMSIQLTKAKDIMKRLVDLSNSSRSLLGDT